MTRQSRCYVIAEAGVNHNGSPARARELVDAAVEAGADAVKFQTFVPELLVSRHSKMAAYQQRNSGKSESQLAMLRDLQLDADAHYALRDHCVDRGIEFLSSPFDTESLQFLVDDLGVQRIKLGSGELTNGPFLVASGQTGLPVILSTGMGNLGEVGNALAALAWGYQHTERQPAGVAELAAAFAQQAGQEILAARVALLHCTTQYPTPAEAVNLRAMATLRDEFGLAVGFSDHTTSTLLAGSAVALGAVIIEKHFTLDKALPGPDHKASLEPAELTAMIAHIRATEECLGDGVKRAAAAEVENLPVARKSLVAGEQIRAGEFFTAANVAIKRPGTGLSPFCYWELVGKTARRDYATDEVIDPDEM